MKTVNEYAQIINDAIAGIEMPAELGGLYDPIRYALLPAGKRLRPVLLVAVNDAFGGEIDECLWPAVGVEIFHNFTLVHDDVMDHADMRRGRPTVAKQFGLNAAILSGDTMVSLAYKSISGCPPMYLPEMIDRFSRMTIDVYEGQQLDTDFETAERVTFDQYLQMIIGKTSALIGYPCSMGALIAGASPADIEAIFNFGILLGIAFQMQDDYLDVYGDPATFGKQIGGDILNNKKTWLHIMAVDQLGDNSRLIAEYSSPEEKIAKVTEIYDSLGIATVGEKLIEQYLADAVECLNETTMPADSKAWFIDFAHSLLKRKK